MARDPRLRLAEYLGHLAHRQVALAQERDQPEPRRLAGGLENLDTFLQGKRGQ